MQSSIAIVTTCGWVAEPQRRTVRLGAVRSNGRSREDSDNGREGATRTGISAAQLRLVLVGDAREAAVCADGR